VISLAEPLASPQPLLETPPSAGISRKVTLNLGNNYSVWTSLDDYPKPITEVVRTEFHISQYAFVIEIIFQIYIQKDYAIKRSLQKQFEGVA